MARIRTVKPEFFKHDILYDLEKSTKLPIRLAFAGLWTVCDREGRFEWRPRMLKTDVLPHDDIDFSRVLDALATRGFVVKYSVDGKDYGYVPGFSRHQVVNNRETASIIPPPEESTISTREPRVPVALPTPLVQDQGEGKGREGKGSRVGDAMEIPSWLPRDDWNAYLEIRRGKKNVVETEHALKGIISQLEKFKAEGYDPVAILNISIQNSWTGVFPPKGNPANPLPFRPITIAEQLAQQRAGA